jgi:hypothetical protein
VRTETAPPNRAEFRKNSSVENPTAEQFHSPIDEALTLQMFVVKFDESTKQWREQEIETAPQQIEATFLSKKQCDSRADA